MMDLYAMREHPKLTAWFGAGLVAVMLVVGGVVLADFNGSFSRDVRVTATLPDNGAVVADNSPVFFQGVEVGEVVGAPAAQGDTVEVTLRLERAQADHIPEDVEITVGPLSVFGNQYVHLVAAAGDDADPISAGTVVPALDENQTPSLQSTFVALDDVLDSVSPAKLNVGLSGLSQALTGRGRSLGASLVAADEYLTEMLELWPTVVDDLNELAPFATTLALSTPEFLDLLQNAAISAETLTEHEEGFNDLLAGGGVVSDQVARLIRRTMDTYADTVGGAVALFEALSQSPRVIARMLTGINRWAGSWVEAMDGGTLQVKAKRIEVVDPSALALAVVSGEDVEALLNRAVQGRLVNPPTYTAADCPRYGKQSGDCGGAR